MIDLMSASGMHAAQGRRGSLPGSSRSRTVSFFFLCLSHMTYASPMHITYESHYFYRSQIDSKKTIISVLGLRAREEKFPCSDFAMPHPAFGWALQPASLRARHSRQAEREPGLDTPLTPFCYIDTRLASPPYSNAGVAGLLRSTPKNATFSLTATYSLSAYPNSLTICVLCIPLILLISAAE